jgi:hypothetical protein
VVAKVSAGYWPETLKEENHMNSTLRAALAAGGAAGLLAGVLGFGIGWAIMTGSIVTLGVKKAIEKAT